MSSEEVIDLGIRIGGGLAALFVTWQGTVMSWKKFKKSMMRPKERTKCEDCKACETNLFTTLDYYSNVVSSPTFKLCNDYKTFVARDMLLDKFNAGKTYLPRLFCYIQNFESNRAFSELVRGTMEMIDHYNAKWKSRGINTRIIDGVNTFHQPNVDDVFRDVATQLKKMHLSKKETMERVSIAFEEAYANFFRAVIQYIDERNGDIKGDIYKGKVNTGEYIKQMDSEEYETLMASIASGVSFSEDK